jgi:hypothetical protein
MQIARWCAVLLFALIALGGIDQTPLPVGPSYEVVAPLLSVKGGPTNACDVILLSLPPAGCSGVLLRRVDISQVAGVVRYRNGTMETPPMRLVGVWSGLSLTLTQVPRPAGFGPSARDTACTATSPDTEPALLAREQSVVHDWSALEKHGILLMSIWPCGEALDLLVAVADAPAIGYLRATYGPVEVFGWLSPVTGSSRGR